MVGSFIASEDMECFVHELIKIAVHGLPPVAVACASSTSDSLCSPDNSLPFESVPESASPDPPSRDARQPPASSSSYLFKCVNVRRGQRIIGGVCTVLYSGVFYFDYTQP